MGDATILDGKATAKVVREAVARQVEDLVAQGLRPGLAVVLTGEDPASQVYVRNKDRAASEAGIEVRTVLLAATTSQAQLEGCVRELAADTSVHGILVQLPLPRGLDADAVIRCIPPSKDVDGLHPENVAALVTGTRGLVPCTPAGCMELLDRHGVELEGREVVVVGRSMLVGKPVALLALARNATVTICHSRTRELDQVCGRADVLVDAVGRAHLVRGSWIRPGATVIDVGINRDAESKLVGDVDFAGARARAALITPVPGGVGPMTIAMLLRNTLLAARAAAG